MLQYFDREKYSTKQRSEYGKDEAAQNMFGIQVKHARPVFLRDRI